MDVSQDDLDDVSDSELDDEEDDVSRSRRQVGSRSTGSEEKSDSEDELILRPPSGRRLDSHSSSFRQTAKRTRFR